MFIDVDARQPLKLLARLGHKLDNTVPLMKEISGVLEDSVQQNFAEEGRPKWAELRPATKARRARQGKSGKALQVTGRLVSSIHARYGPNEAAVGTNYPSAPTHQFGAKKGAYGVTKHGSPIPWGDVPARPFLRLAEDDIREIEQVIGDYLDI